MHKKALGVLVTAMLVGCALHHERPIHGSAEDSGIGVDSSVIGVDSSVLSCPLIGCPSGCTVIIGSDGCPTCRCEPPPTEMCETDTDCVIATDLSQCCLGCGTAFPAARAEADPCIARRGDLWPRDCRPSSCLDDCADIDCFSRAARAVCEAGTCVTSSECAADQVVFEGECMPRCASHADCVIARNPKRCCGRTCDAVPRALALDRPCWVAPGESDAECPIDPLACEGIDCALMECPPAAHAACLGDGMCTLVVGAEPCPPGYLDVSGICFRFGILSR